LKLKRGFVASADDGISPSDVSPPFVAFFSVSVVKLLVVGGLGAGAAKQFSLLATEELVPKLRISFEWILRTQKLNLLGQTSNI
jgi:hypothetical protein